MPASTAGQLRGRISSWWLLTRLPPSAAGADQMSCTVVRPRATMRGAAGASATVAAVVVTATGLTALLPCCTAPELCVNKIEQTCVSLPEVCAHRADLGFRVQLNRNSNHGMRLWAEPPALSAPCSLGRCCVCATHVTASAAARNLVSGCAGRVRPAAEQVAEQVWDGPSRGETPMVLEARTVRGAVLCVFRISQ